MQLKPILKYAGGKSKEIPVIEKYIPKFEHYFEPFCGGASLFFYLNKPNSHINDINQHLINFYLSLKNNSETILKEIEHISSIYLKNVKNYTQLKLNSKDDNNHIIDENEVLYYKLRDMFNGKTKKEFDISTLYFFLNKTAYSGLMRTNKKGEFNVPYGRYKNFHANFITDEHVSLLKSTNIYNNSYEKMFETADSNEFKNSFLFIDPPYDSVFTNYNNTSEFLEKEQRSLAENFKNLNSKAMIVIGKTPLIESLYKNYIKFEYDKEYVINIKNRMRVDDNNKTKHLIITNY